MALQDQGAIMRSGMGLVPNYAEEQYRKQQMQLQQGQLAKQQQAAAAKQQEAQREQIRAASFDQDVQGYLAQPTPQSLISLMAKYPEQSEALKRAYEAQTSQSQAGDMRMAGEIYGFAQNGRYDLAANKMRAMIEAQKRGGQPDDPEDMAVLADLESDDPLRQKRALGIVGMQLAIASGDKFATTYGELNPKLSPQMKEYDDRVAKFGKEAADRWLKVQDTKLVPVQAGGSIYSADDLINGGNGFAPSEDQNVRTEIDPLTGKEITIRDDGNGVSITRGGDPASRGAPLDKMVQITLGSESGNRDYNGQGGVLTSPKGAKGKMQVLDGTNRDPGYGVTPAKDNSLAERARVGRDYLKAMIELFGDPAQAWAAYNAGPKTVQNALEGGGSWLAKMPKETRDYVNKNMRQLRGSSGGPVKVTSVQQARRLPPGTQFVTPDGRTMTR